VKVRAAAHPLSDGDGASPSGIEWCEGTNLSDAGKLCEDSDPPDSGEYGSDIDPGLGGDGGISSGANPNHCPGVICIDPELG
jgi:hypothetical protein